MYHVANRQQLHAVSLILIVIVKITSRIKNRFEIVYSGYLGSIIILVSGLMLAHHYGGIRFSSFLVSIGIAITAYTIIA